MSSTAEITTLRERLGTFSDGALRALAKKEGIEVPREVERVLLIDLLLEFLEDKFEELDSQDNDSVRLQRKKYDLSYFEEFAEGGGGGNFRLPERYNDMRIVLMLRDPFWAFAYWDVKGGTLKSVKKEHEADNVVLRVLRVKRPRSPRAAASPVVLDSFDIPIDAGDSSRYITIPQQDAFYCAALVLQGKTWEKQLVGSNIVCVPAVKSLEGLLQNDMAALSEAQKLDVAQPEEGAFPGPLKSIPQRISSPETEHFLERGRGK
ncbi:MAG: DUF4912 domain-containing protein [Spirochaetia bacterium]|jgi:hypothetical protein|nr:DUF4912 domain-containing protein [Spirochaetia bacterium]